MPIDFDGIRDKNIARYGWDTAVLELLGQLYSDRTHFIFELIQNAEDAGATELAFDLAEDALTVRHNGRPFTEQDVRSICGVGQSTKTGDLTQIGRFGIGFKSVYAYTNTPRIYSADTAFRIESYVRPHAEPRRADLGPDTVFVFPFDRDEVPASLATAEIGAALTGLTAGTLLFLRSITRITTVAAGLAGSTMDRVSTDRDGSGRHVLLTTTRAGGRDAEDWLVWARPLADLGQPDLAVEIAFEARAGLDGQQLARREHSPLVVAFPTEKETYLGFLIAGPYRTTPARDNVPEHDPWNLSLTSATAGLLTDVLVRLRGERLLTPEVLRALPVDPGRFAAGSMFRPLYDAVREALTRDSLIPDAAGGHAGPAALRLTESAELRALLTPEQLGELCGADGPVGFVHPAITERSAAELFRYLRDELEIEELTPESATLAMTSEYFAARSDQWIGRLYDFLYQHPALWRAPGDAGEPPGPAWSAPIIRLTSGEQVAPFDSRGRPAAYLPGPIDAGLPTVRPEIAGLAQAHRFLVALGLSVPDALSEVLDHVLPRYADADVATLDPVRHEADLELIARALADASAAARDRLAAALSQTAFLVGENAGTGERRCRPGELYLRAKPLEVYFDGNPAAWFAADSYGPWLAQLRDMGVRDQVRLTAREPDQLGYVPLVAQFARNERGLAGFDPDARLDGLDYALRNPSFARSEYVWNMLLVPNRQLIAGVIEKSPRQSYADATREEMRSGIGELAAGVAWLPAPDGTYQRPADLDAEQLPSSFERDDVVARALGMVQPAVAEASRQLGYRPGFLRELSQHPDLIARIEAELADRRG